MSAQHSAPAAQIESPEMILRRAPVCASLIMATGTTNSGLMTQRTVGPWVSLDNCRRDADTLNRLKTLIIWKKKVRRK